MSTVLLIPFIHLLVIVICCVGDDADDLHQGGSSSQMEDNEWDEVGHHYHHINWLYSNYPTAPADNLLNVSELCVSDTKKQLVALRHRLPWAIKSKSSS